MISHLARRTTVALAALALIVLSAAASAAQAPVDVTGPVTDPDGALGSRSAEVRAALDDHFDQTGHQLFVVLVPSFDGLDGQEWAEQSAARSDLASQDVLWAVATQDRAYGYFVGADQQLSDSDLERVEREDVLPRLREEDWAGAAIAAARGYADAADGGGIPWVPVGIGGIVLVGAGAVVVRRRRASGDTSSLDASCAAALVRVDNTLTTSEQELAFAEAQFGREATAAFREVLTQARSTTQKAFALRQQLDDAEPETTAEHRRIATEIIDLCTQVESTIDEQVEAFDTLRDLHAHVPESLAAIPERAAEVSARLTTSRAVLDRLRSQHPQTTLASVEGNVDHAERLVAEALDQAELGAVALAADDRATAVVHAQAAQEAVSQATAVLDALDAADSDIAAAPQQIAARLSSLGPDLDDVTRLGATEPTVAPAAAAARDAMAYATQPGHDPLAAVRRLQTAEAELDEALAPLRAAAAEAEKARIALTESLGRVTSRVRAVSGFIETRRGAVGADARTRLSEAARHLDRAQQLTQTDPAAALEALTVAERQIDDAERLAQADVRRWEDSQRSRGGGTRSGGSIILGGISSGSHSRSRPAARTRTRTTSRRAAPRSSSRRGRGGGGRF